MTCRPRFCRHPYPGFTRYLIFTLGRKSQKLLLQGGLNPMEDCMYRYLTGLAVLSIGLVASLSVSAQTLVDRAQSPPSTSCLNPMQR